MTAEAEATTATAAVVVVVAAVLAAVAAEEAADRVTAWGVEATRPDRRRGGRGKCDMMRTFPLCFFETGKTCGTYWRGQSYQKSTAMLFERTGTFVVCLGKTVRVKLSRPHLPGCGSHHNWSAENIPGG